MAASTAPYRVTTTTQVSNRKYYAGSTDPRRSSPVKVIREHFYYSTLEAAQAFQAKNGGVVQALTASGKSYRTIK